MKYVKKNVNKKKTSMIPMTRVLDVTCATSGSTGDVMVSKGLIQTAGTVHNALMK